MKKIAIFDVCGTLFNTNTTFDFIKYYHKEQKNYVKHIFCLFLSSIFAKVLHRFFNFSIRKFFLLTLKGEKKADLDNLAESYFKTILLNKKIDKIYDIFKQFLDDPKFEVELNSASIEPVILAISKQYDIKYNSSKLEYTENGICYGRLALDLKGKKDSYLPKINGDVLFYSDNLDDLVCASVVTNYFFIKKKKNINSDIGSYKNVKIINI